jgi:hypothetical protein
MGNCINNSEKDKEPLLLREQEEETNGTIEGKENEALPSYRVGDMIVAKDKHGGIYSAKVILVTPTNITVTWPGYGSTSDETIPLNSNRILQADPMRVLKPVSVLSPKSCATLVMTWITEKPIGFWAHDRSRLIDLKRQTPDQWDEVNKELDQMCVNLPFWFAVFQDKNKNLPFTYNQWVINKGHKIDPDEQFTVKTSGHTIVSLRNLGYPVEVV